ncbi:hypothetical protein BC567DRAFT_212993 [Phyllosticta citribraziliensis]
MEDNILSTLEDPKLPAPADINGFLMRRFLLALAHPMIDQADLVPKPSLFIQQQQLAAFIKILQNHGERENARIHRELDKTSHDISQFSEMYDQLQRVNDVAPTVDHLLARRRRKTHHHLAKLDTPAIFILALAVTLTAAGKQAPSHGRRLPNRAHL